jgi:prepilin-type N-terminal cleavage/methylation domain-containing protein
MQSKESLLTRIRAWHDTSLTMQRGRSRKAAFTLVELLVVIAIIGILVALLLPAIQAAREAARRAQCQNNIKNASLAVLNYESAKKILPMGTVFPELDANGLVTNPTIQTNVKFGASWVVSILPYLENQALYDSFVFKNPTTGAPVPMQDAQNIDERGTVLPVLLCPTDGHNQVKYQGHGGNWARGNYAANLGLGTTHTLPTPPGSIQGPGSPAWKSPTARGVMGPNCSVTLKQITDGTSKTGMIGEIRAGFNEGDPRGSWAFGHVGGNLLGFHGWGGDDSGPNWCGPSSDDVGGVTPFDCSGLQLAADCMTCNFGSFDQQTTRSMHTGGVFVAMCDGSVQFISDDIETTAVNTPTCCRAWDQLWLSQDNGTVPPPGRP